MREPREAEDSSLPSPIMETTTRKRRRRASAFFNQSSLSVLITVALIALMSTCVEGQKNGTTDNVATTACMCGVARVPCGKTLTSSDCANGRVISRRDCPCCFVCAKQLTEECNHEELLCDSDYGLECGSDKRCKAKTQCSDDTGCSNDLMCVGGACADPCKVLPDMCQESNMKNGICVSRNHRALCTCPPGTMLMSPENDCVKSVEEAKKCEAEGRVIPPGGALYMDKCQKSCKCESSSGELVCDAVVTPPTCPEGFIPMSNLTGDMTETCKILVGNDALFDGCCVPQQCQVIKKSQDNHVVATAEEVSKGGRDFKLTESHNNLDEDDKSKLKVIESTMDEGAGLSSPAASDHKEEVMDEEMQVIVTDLSDRSAVIHLPKNDKEALLLIALSKELIQNKGRASEVWKEHRIPPGLPQITLSTLLPNTSYTLKYSVDGKEAPPLQFNTEDPSPTTTSSVENNASEESSTEVKDVASHAANISSAEQEDIGHHHQHSKIAVAATTTVAEEESSTSHLNVTSGGDEGEGETMTMTTMQPPPSGPASSVGCLHNGTSYEIGEVFHIGCDERCECLSNSEVKCMERCSIPLFKKGAFAHDKMCFEEPSGIDDCCVIIACARGNQHGHGRNEESGREIIAIIPQPCDSVNCGLNAHCLGPTGMLSEEEVHTNQTLCVCDEGHLGDPYDEEKGCQPPSNVTPTSASSSTSDTSSSLSSPSTTTSTQKAEGCVSKNKTYEFGEEQVDDCSYKCKCESSGEFLCVPRCNYRRDEEKEIPAGCEIQKDPSDSECCEILVCQGEPLESGGKKKDEGPIVPKDGCVYKNQSYVRDQKFYDGCDHQCMCFPNGDVTCQPRCPPAASNSSTTTNNSNNTGAGDHHQQHNCVTLPDPTDNCCTVTVCDNSTLRDVMKSPDEVHSITTTTTTVPPVTGEGRSGLPASVPPSLSSHSIRISLIHPVNDTTVMVAVRVFDGELGSLANELLEIQYSTDDKTWHNVTSKVKNAIKTGRAEVTLAIPNLTPKTEYFFRAKLGGAESNTAAGFTKYDSLGSLEDGEFVSSEFASPGESQEEEGETTENDSAGITSAEKLQCIHKDKKYEYGEEFFDECQHYCTCRRGGKMKCVEIDCPSDGLDLLDDTCVKWEPDSKFKKVAPNCCPPMRCVQHSSCTLDNGLMIRNFDEVPQKITGCDKRCYCEFGNITCQNLCPPMSELPPTNLPCPKEFAVIVTMPENECCIQWSCRMPQIPPHHLSNLTDLGGPLEASLNKSTATPKPKNEQIVANTSLAKLPPKSSNNGTQLHVPDPHKKHGNNKPSQSHHQHPHSPHHGHGPPDKLNPHQLQELLHHLTNLGEDQGGPDTAYPPNSGTYVQVQTPQQVEELERELGAKYIERGEDGSYILMIPSSDQYDDQNYSDHMGPPQGPPVSHAIPPAGFPVPGGHFPFGLGPFQIPGGPHSTQQHDRSKISHIVIHPLNESTLQIDFTVSPVLVGLQGHVEVLFTSEFEHKPNPAQWERKVFQQAEDLIDNTHLQLFLSGLKPDTEYYVQIKVVVVQSEIGSSSDFVRVRTPPLAIPTTTLPPEITVDPEMQLRTASPNSVRLHWRKFTDLEKNLIDGVQIAYKASEDKVYSTTPLIHRSLDEYEVENLHPNKDYEINLLFIPFDTNQTTVLKSEKPIFVHTSPTHDEYAFDIALSHGKITERSVELIIEGVPHPEDKFVNIYQVIYMNDPQKEMKDYFKVPKRETSKKATLTDLIPATNYTMWLEAFLSNGKKKRSNVISVQTKAAQLPHPEMSGEGSHPHNLRASEEAAQQASSYYGALVALAIVAALSIIGVIALLMILIRKQNYAKAPINDRKSESSYDNPSFKSYDVESNGHLKPSEL